MALDHEYQQLAANAIAHEARMASVALQAAAAAHERPSAIYRPAISIDGNKWCALYGDNLQDGVAGFGDSPALAMEAFDAAWFAKLAGINRQAEEAARLKALLGECELFLRTLGLDSEPAAKLAADCRVALGKA